MALAIFDLDNTLIGGDSDHLWGEFMIAKGIVDAASFKSANDRFYQQYQDGSLDIYRYLEFALAPLSRLPLDTLESLHREFMSDYIDPIILPKAADLVHRHRSKGDTLLVITATNRFVVEPIVNRYGIDNLLASEPERNHSGYTGSVIGIPCFQNGKVARLEQWLAQSNNAHLKQEDMYFYSDSANDMPLLERATHPVAVDPDTRLNEAAKARGWPVISLR